MSDAAQWITESVLIARAHRQLHHFERAAEIDIEAAFLGFAIERRRAVDYGIRGADKIAVIALIQAKAGIRQVAQENSDARVQVGLERGEIHVQLQGMPQARARFVLIARADQ